MTGSVFYIRLMHAATGVTFIMPVLAASLEDALFKAKDVPYSNDGYVVLGESK